MVVEITTFRLATDESAFLAADARVQAAFYYLQPGLVRRTTAKGDPVDGWWVVVTLWDDLASAAAAADAAGTDPAAIAFALLVDLVEVRRYETLD